MKNCINCQTQFQGSFCPECGITATRQYENVAQNVITDPVITDNIKPAKKGKVSAVIRLLLMTLSNIAAVIVLAIGMFRDTSMTFTEQLVDTIASSAMIVFIGIWLWGFVKWCVFAIPKTFRAAKKIANTIIPLSLFAFAAELMICIWLTLIPISVYSFTLTPVMLVVGLVENNPENILIPLVMLAASAFGTYYLGKKDFVKFFGNKKVQGLK